MGAPGASLLGTWETSDLNRPCPGNAPPRQLANQPSLLSGANSLRLSHPSQCNHAVRRCDTDQIHNLLLPEVAGPEDFPSPRLCAHHPCGLQSRKGRSVPTSNPRRDAWVSWLPCVPTTGVRRQRHAAEKRFERQRRSEERRGDPKLIPCIFAPHQTPHRRPGASCRNQESMTKQGAAASALDDLV